MKAENRIKYEKQFSELVGGTGARAFALGRQALVVLLKAAGLKAGGEFVGTFIQRKFLWGLVSFVNFSKK